MLALVLMLLLGGCERASAPPGPAAAVPPVTVAVPPERDPAWVERVTDALRLGEHAQQVLAGARAQPAVWDLGAQYRPVLAQQPGRVQLGPIPPGGDACRVVFGVAARGALGADRPLLARLRVSGPDAVAAAPIFEHAFAGPSSGWIEREIAVPGSQAVTHLIFEADGAAGEVGWSAPHVACRVPRKPLPALDRPHVILISVDTLRADHLGVYGYGRDTSPVLDAFARDALVFDRAFSPTNWTLPSHASLFTGVAPSVHRAGHASPFDPLPKDGVPTIAERLRDAGYWTIAFTAGGIMGRSNGLDRGFQWWTERTRANAQATLPGLFDAIGTAPTRPLFLVFHTYDAHGPYAYLPGADAIQVATRAGARTPAWEQGACVPVTCGDARAEWERVLSIGYHRYQRLDRFSGIDATIDAYDRGIRFVDTQLGALFERLRDVGIFENALVIVTSDHGESLYDRGLYFGHSYTLFDEEVRVPLIVRLPDASRTGRSESLVGLMDVAAGILDVAGVPRPESFEGRSPFAIETAAAAQPGAGAVSGESVHARRTWARSPDAKAIPATRGEAESVLVPNELLDRYVAADQLFDLTSDPGERDNRATATSQPADAARVRTIAGGVPEPGSRNLAPAPALEAEQEQQLRELGYLR